MNRTKIKVNSNNDELYCNYSKERIAIGEKYAEVHEDCLDDLVIKTYKLDNVPEDDEDEDSEPYISEQ